MSRRDIKDEAPDDSGILNKVTTGRYEKLDGLDGLHAAEFATGFLPGVGQAVSPVVSAFAGGEEARREFAKLAQQTKLNLGQEAYHSNAIKTRLQRLKDRWKDRLGEASFSTGGAIAGAGLAALLIPVTGGLSALAVGGVGSLAGGMGANFAYNKINPRADQDAFTIVAMIDDARKAGQAIPPEAVFAALAANVPGRAGKKLEDRLEQLTGTRQFNEAVAMGKFGELNALMQEYGHYVRARTQMWRDPKAPLKSTSEQFAEMINGGTLPPAALLLDRPQLKMNPQPAAYAAAMPGLTSPLVPNLPVVGRAVRTIL